MRRSSCVLFLCLIFLAQAAAAQPAVNGKDAALNFGPTPASLQPRLGLPLNVATGNVYWQDVDLSLPAPGFAIAVRRHYNSQSDRIGSFGTGWSSAWDAQAEILDVSGGTRHVRLHRETGRAVDFDCPKEAPKPGKLSFCDPVTGLGRALSLIEDDAGWTLVELRGRELTRFAKAHDGRVTARLAPAGPALRYARDAQSGAVTRVESGVLEVPEGGFGDLPIDELRAVADEPLAFVYSVLVVSSDSGSGRVTTIHDPAGSKVAYEYAGSNLVAVHQPDGGRAAYTYGANGALSDVFDPAARLAAHFDYDPDATAAPIVTGGHRGLADGVALSARRIDFSGGTRVAVEGSEMDDGSGSGKTRLKVEWTVDVRSGVGAVIASSDPGWTCAGDCGDCAGCGARSWQKRTFDANLDCTSEIDFAGVETRFEVDALGNLTRRVRDWGGDEVEATFDYDPDWNLLITARMPSVIKSRVRTTTIARDPATGLETARTEAGFDFDGEPIARTTEVTRDGFGRLVRYDGPRDDVPDVVEVAYHAFGGGGESGRRAKITRHTGSTQLVSQLPAYSANGHAASIVDANGVETAVAFDARDRVVEERTVLGAGDDRVTGEKDDFVWARGWALDGTPRSVTTRAGQQVARKYDGGNRPISLLRLTAAGVVVEHKETDYDAEGHPVAERVFDDRAGELVTRDGVLRDPRGRPLAELLPDPNDPTSPDARIVFKRDLAGRLTASTDARGFTTSYTWDSHGRVVAIDQPHTPQAPDWTLTRNADGRVRELRDPLGNAQSLLYDDFGNLRVHQGVDGGTWLYDYDAAGNPTRHRHLAAGAPLSANPAPGDVDLAEVTLTHDALGRMTSRHGVDCGGRIGIAEAFRYDEADVAFGRGRRTSMDDASGLTRFHHDGRGRLTREQWTHPAYGTWEQRLAWDSDSVLASVRTWSGRDIELERDGADPLRVANMVADIDGLAVKLVGELRYLPFEHLGAARSWNTGNGLAVERELNLRRQISGLRVTGGGGAAVLARSLSFDADGNVVHVDIDGGAATLAYGYDAVDRVVDAQSSASNRWAWRSYVYDPVGNVRRIDRDGGVDCQLPFDVAGMTGLGCEALMGQPSPVNGTRSVFGERHQRYAYDGAGAVTAITSYADDDFDQVTGLTTITYDALDRTAKVGDLEMVYDGRSRRRVEQRADGSVALTFFGARGVHGDFATRVEIDADAAVRTTGVDIIGYAGQRFARVDWSGSPEARDDGDVFWYHDDHLGTPQKLTDAGGKVAWSGDYDPYRLVEQEPIATEQPLRFPGQIELAGGEIAFNGLRFYEAASGAYLSLDPMHKADALYTYTGGRPTRLIDPSGAIPPGGSSGGCSENGAEGELCGGDTGCPCILVVDPNTGKSDLDAIAEQLGKGFFCNVFGGIFCPKDDEDGTDPPPQTQEPQPGDESGNGPQDELDP